MHIKKIGHCCLLIQHKNVTILTDPGVFSSEQNDVTGIDIVLVTHEHQDHFHVDSVKKILVNNPNAKIVANKAVAALLEKETIPCMIVGEGEKNDTLGVLIEGYGHKHAEIYKEIGQVENTGYFIDGLLFYPGDAFTDPNRPVDILALPVAGPWMKIREAIDYAIALKPRAAFPVHDAILNPNFLGFFHQMFSTILSKENINFTSMRSGEENEF
jgi:L-ascorbate metabolism protein UlaG (beta-lactamase superfamily)